MEKIVDVAQYIFINYKKMSGKVIDEMKLHKLLYLVQRESLAINGSEMFPESFEGWKYGPVSRKVRNCYTEDGMFGEKINDISLESAYIVNNILLQYGVYESWKLSKLTHNEISWKNARKGIAKGENGKRKLKIEDIKKDSEKVRPYDSVWDMYYDEFDDAEEVM